MNENSLRHIYNIWKFHHRTNFNNKLQTPTEIVISIILLLNTMSSQPIQCSETKNYLATTLKQNSCIKLFHSLNTFVNHLGSKDNIDIENESKAVQIKWMSYKEKHKYYCYKLLKYTQGKRQMFYSAEAVSNPRRISKIVSHHISNVRHGLLSPLRLKSVKSNSNSTSPSPQKLEGLTPSKKKIKRTTSKLFEAARQTISGQTFLGGSSSNIPEVFGSTKLNRPRNCKQTSDPCPKSQGKLEIMKQYDYMIGGEPTISQIMHEFEEGLMNLNELPRIAQNVEQMLELNSKLIGVRDNFHDLLERE